MILTCCDMSSIVFNLVVLACSGIDKSCCDMLLFGIWLMQSSCCDTLKPCCGMLCHLVYFQLFWPFSCSSLIQLLEHHLQDKNTRKSVQNSDKQNKNKNTKYTRVKYMHIWLLSTLPYLAFACSQEKEIKELFNLTNLLN